MRSVRGKEKRLKGSKHFIHAFSKESNGAESRSFEVSASGWEPGINLTSSSPPLLQHKPSPPHLPGERRASKLPQHLADPEGGRSTFHLPHKASGTVPLCHSFALLLQSPGTELTALHFALGLLITAGCRRTPNTPACPVSTEAGPRGAARPAGKEGHETNAKGSVSGAR